LSYERRIGWRYLYRGTGARKHALGLVVSLLVAVAGGAMFLTSAGSSGLAIIALAAGMFSAVLFGLLYVFSVFTTVSVLGVVFGVAALTVVLSVTTGFQKQFRDKVLGVNAHITITKTTNDFVEYEEVERIARQIDPDVIAVQPFVFVEMLITRGKGDVSGVAIKGVDPARVSKVLDLYQHMIEGSAAALAVVPRPGEPPPIIVGKVLARKIKARVGDELTVVNPLSNVDTENWSSTGAAPRSKTFRIAGVFYSGFDEYDRRVLYIPLLDAMDLFYNQQDRGPQKKQVQGIELKLADVERAGEISTMLEQKLGGAYLIQPWDELNRNLFTALALQKIVLLIILTLIIAVAAFNMISALTMMVIDKTREIAILKSMGATSSGIARMFQVVGLAIGGVGTLSGLAIGLTLCKVVERYNYPLDPKVYLIDRLPIAVNPTEVVLVAVIAMVISALATLLPASQASSLMPVDGLRYD
jgi:lipoprotein-releasing system permease protein